VKTLKVDLGDRSYPIHVGDGLLADPAGLQAILDPHIRGRQVCVVTNPTVAALYGDALQSGLGERDVDVFEMGDGEAHKNMATYADVMDFLMARRHNRTTCLIALGGGVVGDLCGFVAATFQRGVDFIQVPTTLLAQVDSSVGGKTAINHAAGKNMIGAFYQPRCVIADTATLSSLSQREYTAGLAEVVKYGVIVDAEFFAWLESNAQALQAKDAQALEFAIERSCAIKARVVAEDERESGLRAILNFGHTFGHAIEALSGYGTFLHGEAVAVGMAMAADLSVRKGMLPADDAERIVELLATLDLPVSLASNNRLADEDMLDAMGMDKKVVDGSLRFVLASRLGSVEVRDDVELPVLAATLSAFGP
jgi:3-dehydroquinate synthase